MEANDRIHAESAVRAHISVSGIGYSSLVLVLFFSCYFGLGAYGLLNNNEGLYAEIGREMLRSHSFVIPTLDYVPYIEKPPLLYWLLAGGYRLFGVSALSARLIPASAALLLCMGIVHFGRHIRRPLTGIIGALVLASSLGFILLARTVMFDMLLTACITLALLWFYSWYESRCSRDLRLAYLFLGLAVMAKGLVALVLVPLTAIAFLLWTDRARLRPLLDGWGILILALVTVPWHLAAILSDPSFAWFYFINEHVLRFLGLRKPADFRTGPFFYYVPIVMAGFLPWTAWLGLALRPGRRREPLEKLVLVWFLVFFLFFSASRAKGTYYLITALPAAALFTAMQIERYASNRSRVNTVCAFAGLGAATLLVCATLFHYRGALPGTGLLVIDAVSVAALAVGISLAAKARASPQNRALLMSVSLAGLVVPFSLSVVTVAAAAQDRYSAAQFMRTMAPKIGRRPLVSFRDFEEISSVLFYLGRRLPIVASTSRDLQYGQRASRDSPTFLTSAELARRLETEKIFIVVPEARLREFGSTRFRPLVHRVGRVGNLLLFGSTGKVGRLGSDSYPINLERCAPWSPNAGCAHRAA